ncbi:MAG: alpha/beta hydrolase, partial [Alphaproteobacteria bacterium]
MPTAAGSRQSRTRRRPALPPPPARPFSAAARTYWCSSMGSPMRLRPQSLVPPLIGEWFASSPVAGADMTVLAFSWPSDGQIAVPPHFLSGAYQADQARAGSSGAHLAWFLDEVKSLRDEAKRQNPRRRVVLLAHSMGNFALAAGVQ